MTTKNYKPGQTVPFSAQFQQVGPRGGIDGRPEITGVRGKTFPPSPQKGITYKPADRTRHTSKK